MCTNSIPSQTELTAHLLINALAPKQRALLFAALINLENDMANVLADQQHNKNMVPALANRVHHYLQWSIAEIKETKKILFADCFIDDLEISQHFIKEFPMPKTNKG